METKLKQKIASKLLKAIVLIQVFIFVQFPVIAQSTDGILGETTGTGRTGIKLEKAWIWIFGILNIAFAYIVVKGALGFIKQLNSEDDRGDLWIKGGKLLAGILIWVFLDYILFDMRAL